MLKFLGERERGRGRKYTTEANRHNSDVIKKSETTQKIIDDEFGFICETVSALSVAIEGVDWPGIEDTIHKLVTNLLETTNDNIYHITPRKKQQREIFVALGGMQLLLHLVEPSFGEVDARSFSKIDVRLKSEFWNELLVIIREICYAVTAIADNLFTSRHLSFLFTLLAHSATFENTMNLLEEVLAIKVDTFNLANVPNLYSLIDGFSTRQLAHFRFLSPYYLL